MPFRCAPKLEDEGQGALGRRPRRRGFSLLEMMVAIALLSVGLVLLLQVQARSIQLAQSAREMTVATMLTRAKMLDCETDFLKKGFSVGDYDEQGNFEDEGYPTFFWECHAYMPELPEVSAGEISSSLMENPEGGQAASPMGSLGMDILAPVMSQLSNVMKDSLREMVVIVRWGTGEDMEEMTVTTHLIDKTAVNNVAAMLSQASAAIPSLPGSGGTAGPAGGGAGGGPTSPSAGGGKVLR